jgi:hypothetical protein
MFAGTDACLPVIALNFSATAGRSFSNELMIHSPFAGRKRLRIQGSKDSRVGGDDPDLKMNTRRTGRMPSIHREWLQAPGAA